MAADAQSTARAWLRLPLAALLFASCLWLFSRHHEFPFFYHPDEPDKVEQIVHEHWNFHHPLLMLATARCAVNLFHVPRDAQAVAQMGRWVSATFAALGVTALAWLAFLYRGWPGFATAGAALMLHHQVFELAHYFKEDTALFLGIAMSLLALVVYWKKPCAPRAAFLGFGCALALCGKYLGAVMLLAALPVLWCAPPTPENRRARFAQLAIFAAAFLLTAAAVNFSLLQNLAIFRHSLGREVQLVAEGQNPAPGAPRIGSSAYLGAFFGNTTPVIWLCLLAHLFRQWKRRKSLALSDWILTLFPFAYALMLSLSPKTNDRYFLPATAMFTWLAALGALDVALLWPRIPAALCAVALAACQLPSFMEYDRAFQIDDRKDLRAWLDANLTGDDLIAQDYRSVKLPLPGKNRSVNQQPPLTQRVLPSDKLAGELGTLDTLKAQGVTHVIVSQNDYGRYFRKAAEKQTGGAFVRAKTFYETLFAGGQLVWERARGPVIYLHPGLRVYRIGP